MMKKEIQSHRLDVVDIVLSAIFPPSILGVLGRIFGALALFALLQFATDFGLSATGRLILDIYLVALKNTVGLLDPFVRDFIKFINDLFNVKLVFAEGWRHIFVVLQILFVRDAGTAFSDGRSILGIVRLLIGFSIAFSFAVLAFLTELPSVLLSNMLFGLVPVIGIFSYDVVMYLFSSTLFFKDIGVGEVESLGSRKQFFWGGFRRSAFRFFLVGAATLVIFLVPSVAALDFPHGGLIAITAGLVANAAYWIFRGSTYAVKQVSVGQRYRQAFLESESGRFGLSVVGILFWFTFFCALNAGMRLIGF